VPDVRTRVDVINRGSEIKLWFGHVPEPSLAGHPNQTTVQTSGSSRPLKTNSPHPEENKVQKSARF
jgi:hypothetical protein